MQDKIAQINSLVNQLNHYRDLYYNEGSSPISDQEYDGLIDSLEQLEEETHYLLSNSPTRSVGYVLKDKLNKTHHNPPLLSLKKTKDTKDFLKFMQRNSTLLMPKADGLTVELLYSNGEFQKASTRGNGYVGDNVTTGARVFYNVPLKIPYTQRLKVVGEAVIMLDDFARINSHSITTDGAEKETSRNLAAGTVRNSDIRIVQQRKIHFKAFDVLEGLEGDSKFDKFTTLRQLGFDVLEFILCDPSLTIEELQAKIDYLQNLSNDQYLPIDGIVAKYDSYAFSKTLGQTSNRYNDGFAFKFKDETELTELTDVIWQIGRTGVLSPVAVFNAVEIDGTEVSRALVHNISYIKALELGIGDSIEVIKSNQIIPQITRNVTKSNTLPIPNTCPYCGQELDKRDNGGVETLYCINPLCSERLIRTFSYVFSKDCINIDGMSEATIRIMVDKGWLTDIADMYDLQYHRDEMLRMDGFGVKKVDKLLGSIEASRLIELAQFINALCIPTIGKASSQIIAKECNFDFLTFLSRLDTGHDFSPLSGIGEVSNHAIYEWYEDNRGSVLTLAQCLHFITPVDTSHTTNSPFTNKTVVLTGTFTNFSRTELEQLLNDQGATVKNTVSKKTDYVIAGEKVGSKYDKAQSLQVAILDEQTLLNMLHNRRNTDA